jgi:hypothetical protein
MRVLCVPALLILSLAVPALAAGETFDPDQIFRQALSRQFLESLLNQAQEAIDEHLEISGHFESAKDGLEPTGELRLRFYPDGKSKSSQHFSAEGWFGPSRDAQQQELHLRFTLPKSSEPASPLPDNVL